MELHPVARGLLFMLLLLILLIVATRLFAPTIIKVGTVCDGGCTYNNNQLQNAIDIAVSGDIIVLTAGETFPTAGVYLLDNDLGTDYVTIQSSRLSELPYGQRVDPSQAALMAKVCSTGTGTEVIGTDRASHYWRLLGLEVAPCATGQGMDRDLILIDERAAPPPYNLGADLTHHHYIIDRCWIHGYANDQGPQRGIRLGSDHTIISNNYIDEIHEVNGGNESHALAQNNAGYNVLIENNYMGAATEGSFTGGGRDYVNNRFPGWVTYRGNIYEKKGSWITYNYNSDPEGTTIPAVGGAISGQPWSDTADMSIHWIKSSTSWRRVYMPAGANEQRCFPGSIWRNQSVLPATASRIWTCNAAGTRWTLGGTDLYSTWQNKTVQSVTTGASTVLFLPQIEVSLMWRQGGGLYPLGVKFSGGTGPWAALNGQIYLITSVVDRASPANDEITINFNSTGFGSGFATLVASPQFTGWPEKNGAEVKSGIGIHFEGNLIKNTWPFTFGNQRGYGFLINWVPDQDGPNTPISDVTFINNKLVNTIGGIAAASIQRENSVSGGTIITGVQTRINTSSFFGRLGEIMYVSGGTGDFADLAFTQGFPIYDVQTSQGGSGAFTSGWSFAYDSSGKSTSGVTLRVRDDSANKANAWPRKHFIDNNIMDIGNAVTIAGYQGNTTTGFDSGVLGYSPTQAVSFQMQTDMDLTRNTIIRRSVGPGTGWVPGLFMESQRMVVHGQSGAPDATMPATFNIHDNVDEGTAGKFTSSATLSTTCRLTLDDYWEPNNGRVYMSGNVATYGDTRDFYALLNTTNNAEYGDSVCPGWKRVYGRTSPSMPFQDTDTSVTVSSNQGTFTFSSAPRLISGSRFCVTASTPSNLVGCYTLPTAVDATSTSWTNVSLPGVPNNTYTGVTLDSAINFTDYNNRNYRLAGGSIFKGTGRDGADPGADQNVVEWATETAESGLPNPYLTTTILYIDTSDTTATICYSAYDSTPATITVATTRTYTPDVGSDSITQSGRRGCATVTGLTASTRYFARMNTTGGRYRDTFSRGRMAEFRTKPYAILEDEYLTSVRTDANTLRSTSAGTTIAFGCHLVWAQANGFVDDFPATYENLTMWQGAVDNMAAAGCTRISINISLAPWIENDATDITRYTDIFTYIKTTKGLGLDLHPQASGRAKTAIQALPACPNGGNPCYDGTFDTPGDWFQGAKGAMRALAQLPATARPHEITVVHEPTSANGQLGISGSAAQWDPQVGNFANDATYGIQNVDTTIIVGAGCHGGEAAYCALFSDRAGVDRIGLDHYGRSTGAAVNIINDALAADGTPKEVFIEEFSHPSWTNTGTQSEQNSIHGYGYARSYSPTCWACDWADAAIRRFSGMGATTINLFWTQPLRYYAADGANDNGLSTTYNNAVAGSPTATLTNFGQFMLNHPLLN